MATWIPTAKTVEKVYDALVAEADLEGFCTATQHRLSEISLVGQQTVHHCLDVLVDQGRIKIISRNMGVKEWSHDGKHIYNVGEYQLLGEEWS